MIDYKELLLKYIAHIGLMEGVTYINFDKPPFHEGRPKYFSEEEWNELKKLDKESLELSINYG